MVKSCYHHISVQNILFQQLFRFKALSFIGLCVNASITVYCKIPKNITLWCVFSKNMPRLRDSGLSFYTLNQSFEMAEKFLCLFQKLRHNCSTLNRWYVLKYILCLIYSGSQLNSSLKWMKYEERSLNIAIHIPIFWNIAIHPNKLHPSHSLNHSIYRMFKNHSLWLLMAKCQNKNLLLLSMGLTNFMLFLSYKITSSHIFLNFIYFTIVMITMTRNVDISLIF